MVRTEVLTASGLEHVELGSSGLVLVDSEGIARVVTTWVTYLEKNFSSFYKTVS